MLSDGTVFSVGDIEKWFDEARRNTKAKHEKWVKYYDRQRRDVLIKVNDWVLWVQPKTKKRCKSGERESPNHPMRREHNKEDQFDPEETENNSTAPTLRSKEGQATGVPEAEEVSNNIARRGQEE
ncbi:hypothetical protein TNCV_2913251 [Trichonephila clavipes]|nr:hypothetical protein TNCV_2913251 [Trichonephila clavipes]